MEMNCSLGVDKSPWRTTVAMETTQTQHIRGNKQHVDYTFIFFPLSRTPWRDFIGRGVGGWWGDSENIPFVCKDSLYASLAGSCSHLSNMSGLFACKSPQVVYLEPVRHFHASAPEEVPLGPAVVNHKHTN